MDRENAVRRYYRAIDDADYDSLAALLGPEFVHRRPDRTLSGRDEFVRFMREGRPRTDTVHAVDAVYRTVDGDAREGAGADAHRRGDGDDAPAGAGGTDDRGPGRRVDEVAVRGRLRDDGEELFGFVDVFAFEGDAVVELTTYTDSFADG
ncbi:nuclear transport factor 2 family protein [Halorarum salinum]|uniref:Nuclear transport factor 2 family protein n=1 Tax=Halorarum salinum TaxID=2743089 RepID=A0A7D5L9K2_9EURY|nr:nuclear transport factor 2 family protein [Halobaculum salinum]QLG61272.1 nuclear transport factor 2 family protein [Halobaculum salinum]